METVLLIARLSLALVFGVAATAKAADIAGLRRTLVDFGLPQKLATPVAGVLPLAEMTVALALLPLWSAWWGAVGALALLVVFAAGIAATLLRGNAPDCNCFGQIHSTPVSWSTFARNLGMAAVAALVVARGKESPGLSAFGWLSELSTAEAVSLALGLAAVCLLGAAVFYLRRVLARQETVLEAVASMKKMIEEDYAEAPPVERQEAFQPYRGLPVGAPAPRFSLPAIDGESVTLDSLLSYGKPVLLLFVSPNCAPCKTLLPIVGAWERDYSDRLTVALLSKGAPEEIRERVTKFGIGRVLVQGESSIVDDYQAKWTPAAVMITREGRIANEVAYGDSGIRSLVNHAITAGAAAPDGSGAHIPHITVGNSLFKVGEPAPRFSLPDLQGKVVGTEDLLGQDTMLLFWDPACGFCQAMHDDIRKFEEKPPEGAPRLVIIASGNGDDVRKKSRYFRSLILHDPQFDIAPIYGSGTTPSAVLIDGEGRIASGLAEGGINVLALAGVRKIELPIASRFNGALQAEPSRIQ